MKDRIKQIRTSLGLNQTEFGERIGAKQTSIAGYETGARKPKNTTIKSICREFSINETWLREGKGEPFVKNEIADGLAAVVKEYGLSPEDRILIEKYIGLSPEERLAVVHYIQAVAKDLENSAKPVPKANVVKTPAPERNEEYTPTLNLVTYDQAAAAGFGSVMTNTPGSEEKSYPAARVPSGANFCVHIAGKSMETRIPDGCTVFAKRTEELNNGDIGIFILNGEIVCKLYVEDSQNRQTILRSLNPDPQFADRVITEFDSFKIQGKVLGWYKAD